MKVVFLVACLTHGGAEKVASLWIGGFVNRGYDVSCILMSDSSPISYPIPDSVHLYTVHADGEGLINNIKQITQIRKYLKLIRPDYLITVIHPLSLFGYIASRGLGIKVINTEHNSFDRPSYAPLSKREKLFKFKVNRLFDVVTIFTHADIKYIGKRLNNVAFLPNPLSMVPAKEVPPKTNIILAVGRMEAWHVKGFDLLIDAWSQICDRYPDWKLQILGGGDKEYRQLLINRAESQSSLDRIDFIEFSENPKHYFNDASIFILSSRYEGFGMVLLEAMSQGCACIACDYKGRQSEILLSHELGICCETNSTEAIAESIVYMIENPEYRESTRMKAIKKSQDYSIENIMDMWERIIKRRY